MNNDLGKLKIMTNLINDSHVGKLTILVEAEEKLLKKNNPFRESLVTKEFYCDFKTNTDYNTEVNKQRLVEGKETNFESGSSWFKLVEKGINGDIVSNKREPDSEDIKYYYKGIVERNRFLKYKIDGVDATKEQIDIIKLYKPKVSEVKSQGVEKPIIVRTYDINNIKEIICNDIILLEEE